jgi:hypothetical protein
MRFGSVAAAAPGTSDTSFVTVYLSLGGAAVSGAAAARATVLNAAIAAARMIDLCKASPFLGCVL